jgi:hypothetical protein
MKLVGPALVVTDWREPSAYQPRLSSLVWSMLVVWPSQLQV